jgi:hypothetical protein
VSDYIQPALFELDTGETHVRCPLCGALPGVRCVRHAAGDHVARWAAARADAVISESQLDAVTAAAVPFIAATVIRESGHERAA